MDNKVSEVYRTFSYPHRNIKQHYTDSIMASMCQELRTEYKCNISYFFVVTQFTCSVQTKGSLLKTRN